MSHEISHKNNDKQRLLQLIVEQGILHDSEQRPLIARDGTTRLNWVMNFLAISLHADHLRLAARQMLTLLSAFEGRQLATIGTAAVPLLSACILESGDKYNGLMVRAKRKAYGTASLIDGRINQAEPVIVLDDSIGSGTNMLDCINKLEQAGLYVEGCACLVRFGYDGGYAQLVERGYRVLSLFDNARDIAGWHPATDWQYDPYPLQSSFQHIVWDECELPDYISPFRAVRASIRHFWQTGKLLRPPKQFNQALDTAGGVWLSLRAQDAMHTSQGRHGFWHFPGDTETACPPLDVSHAAWLFASHLQNDPQREQRLQQGAFGLSLFGSLEACLPGELDQHQYGIALRSTESPWKMGGALPNMPGMSSTAHLLQHARYQNTQLYTHESCQLYRHSVRKLIEPGAEWPYGGVGQAAYRWDESEAIVKPLAEALLEYVQHWHRYGSLSEILAAQAPAPQPVSHYIPPQCRWLFLAVYQAGKQLACIGISPQQADTLPDLVKAAAQDERWQSARWQSAPQASDVSVSHNSLSARQLSGANSQGIYIRLSLLSQESMLGYAAQLDALQNIVPGQDAVALKHEQQFALMLPEVPLEQQWGVAQLNDALYQKADLEQQGQSVYWYSYRTVTWHIEVTCCQLLPARTRLPVPLSAITNQQLIQSCERFLDRQRRSDGLVNSHYQPMLHQVYQQDGLRTTAAVLVLLQPDTASTAWQASYRFIAQELADNNSGSVERAYAVLALLTQSQLGETYRVLLVQQLDILQACFSRHGQLPRPESALAIDHYSIELYVLLIARQQGFYLDTRLLQTAVRQLLSYIKRQATPRQFPVLLQTLVLARSLVGVDLLELQDATLLEGIDRLTQGLLQWQQADGAFMSETADLSPVMFSVRAMNAMLDAGALTGESVRSGLAYLKQYVIRPAHSRYFPAPDYAVGGIYSGLYEGCLSVLLSAQLLKLLRKLQQSGDGDGDGDGDE